MNDAELYQLAIKIPKCFTYLAIRILIILSKTEANISLLQRTTDVRSHVTVIKALQCLKNMELIEVKQGRKKGFYSEKIFVLTEKGKKIARVFSEIL